MNAATEPYHPGTCLGLHRDLSSDGALDAEEIERLQACFSDASSQLRAIRQELESSVLQLPPRSGAATDPLADLRAARTSVLDRIEVAIRMVDKASAESNPDEIREHVERLAKSGAKLLTDISHVISAIHGEYSVTVRGGISMGSYQAGFSWYLTEVLKRRAELVDNRTVIGSVTGASAGSINALLMAVEACEASTGARLANPERSPFYEAWVPVGMFGRHGAPSLTVSGRKSEHPLAFLSGRPLAAAIERIANWSEGAAVFDNPSCAVDVGVTVTHLESVDFPVHYADQHRNGTPQEREVLVEARRLAESFNFRVEADQSTGGRVRISNLRPYARAGAGETLRGAHDSSELREAFPVFGGGYETSDDVASRRFSLRQVLDVVRASAAFPGAFEPVELEYTRLDRNDGPLSHHEGELFIDGGVLNNTPLGLGIELDAWRDGRRISPTPIQASRLCDVVAPVPRTYVFVEPTVTSYTVRSDDEAAVERATLDILGTYGAFIGQFMGSALGAKLIETSERYPWIRRDRPDRLVSAMVVPRRQRPVAGEQLARFMAFFETDFRVYDFYVGAADAEAFRRDDPGLRLMDSAPLADAAKLRCMLDYREKIPAEARMRPSDLPQSCKAIGPNESLFPGGTAASKRAEERAKRRAIRTMADDWRTLPSERADELLWAEGQLEADNFRAMIVGMHNYRRWLTGPKYEPDRQLAKFFSTLDAAGFRFVDIQRVQQLKFGEIDGDQMEVAVREEITRAVDRLAAAQPTRKDRNRVRFLGGLAADRYRVRWPAGVVGLAWVTPVGLELFAGVAPVSFPIRVDVGARLHHFRITTETLGNEETVLVSQSLSGFARIAMGLVRRPVISWEMGLGGLVSLPFGWGTAADTGTQPLRWGLELSTPIVLLKHLFIDPKLSWYLDRLVRGHADDEPISDDFRISLSIGYRFNF